MKKMSAQELGKLSIDEQLRVVKTLGGYKLNELSLASGISPQHIASGLKGVRELKACHIAEMAEYMGYTLQLVPIESDRQDGDVDSDNDSEDVK